jgi:DNA primase
MTNYLNAADIKEQVSLVDLLTRLGYHSLRRSGKELLYLSMLRDSDAKPSFAVNEELNVWFDHGAGKGGNIIDFALAYWPGTPFLDLLRKIQDTCQQEIISRNPLTERISRRRHAVKIPHYEVEEIKDLGNNPTITAYLQSRGIWNQAQGRLKEIYYYVEDQKKLRKHFFAAGWQNEFGSWEVRNKYVQGC